MQEILYKNVNYKVILMVKPGAGIHSPHQERMKSAVFNHDGLSTQNNAEYGVDFSQNIDSWKRMTQPANLISLYKEKQQTGG